jgi:hypothetical protein
MSKNKGNKKIVPNKMSKTVQGKKKLVRKVVKKERNMTVHKISEEQIFINRRTEPNRRNKISERESN